MVNNAEDFALSAGGCGFSRTAGFNLAFTIRHYEEVLYGSDVSLATVIVAANWCVGFFFLVRVHFGPTARHYWGESRVIESKAAATSWSKTPRLFGSTQQVQ